MGKLVLTRRAGESVKLTEPNGDTWLVKVTEVRSIIRSTITASVRRFDGESRMIALKPGQAYTFAGGSLELRPTKRRWPDQAVLAFDFPRDVKIVRTEIA